jgi:glycosyltransferase involved in cell wall biosynthesis
VALRLPTVSIGLPVRNGERYLESAILDFLGQSYEDWELIISDNDSTDATADIARRFAARDRRVRYHRNEYDVGALANANWTVALASGRYFALAAHDDRHSPDFIETLVAALEADPSAIVAYGRCVRIGDDDEPFRYDATLRSFVSPEGVAYPGDPDLERVLPGDPAARFAAVLASGSVDAPMHGLFRITELRRLGGHQLYGSDRLLVARAALAGRFVYVDAPLFRFRIHAGSTLHLDEAARVEREAPGADLHHRRSRTLSAYARAVLAAPLNAAQRLRALAATAGYALRRAASAPGPPPARLAARLLHEFA